MSTKLRHFLALGLLWPMMHCQASTTTPVAEAAKPGQSPEDRRSEMELSKRRRAALWQAVESSVRECYERQDEQFMRPDDQVRFRLDIKDGVVTDAQITSSNLISHGAYRCALDEAWAAPVEDFVGRHVLHSTVYLGSDAKKRELNCPGMVASDISTGESWCLDKDYGAEEVEKATGALGSFEVRKTIRERFKEIRACNTAKTKVGERPRRTVNIELTIAKDGEVKHAEVLATREVSDQTVKCVLNIARTTSFRASPSDTVVRVPFRF